MQKNVQITSAQLFDSCRKLPLLHVYCNRRGTGIKGERLLVARLHHQTNRTGAQQYVEHHHHVMHYPRPLVDILRSTGTFSPNDPPLGD